MASQSNTPVKASCHCGAIRITVPYKPDEINECQCTLCRRYGSAWAYFNPKTVSITIKDNTPTGHYLWGDCDHAFHFCGVCGCLTHWKADEERDRMGVNTRMMEPEHIRTVSRRISFGALRACLKDKETAHPEDQAQY